MKLLTLLACSAFVLGSFSACSTTSKKCETKSSCCASDSKSKSSCEAPAKKHKKH